MELGAWHELETMSVKTRVSHFHEDESSGEGDVEVHFPQIRCEILLEVVASLAPSAPN